MSAIWGNIELNNSICSLGTMVLEYKRKCRLDRIKEVRFKNALIGSGLQFINDEDEYEEMPYIVDGGNTIITADVILDNRKELIKELLIENESVADGRIICLAYEKWHYDIARHLEGAFAIAIYNFVERKLYLCADHTASRCLYYYIDDKSISFSTLISPIIRNVSGIKRNENYIQDFLKLPGLINTVSAIDTPWENMFHLEPGTRYIYDFDKATMNKENYYSPCKVNDFKDIFEAKKYFLDIYEKSIKKIMRTNGGVGITLSSGFDSVSVAALASPILKEQGKTLNSYTYVPFFKDDAEKHFHSAAITDESVLVEEFAKRYSNIRTNFIDNEGNPFTDYIDEMLDILEIPIKPFVNIPFLIEIYEEGYKSGNRIFLNGQYGNYSVSYGDITETFQYLLKNRKYITFLRYYNNYFKAIRKSRKDNFIPELKYLMSLRNKMEQNKKDFIGQRNLFVNKEQPDNYDISSRGEVREFIDNVFSPYSDEKFLFQLYDKSMLSYIGEAETKLGLYCGVVIRDPTKSKDILDFCYSIPYEFFCYEGKPRYLVRGFLEDEIPDEILYPYVKRGIQGADWIDRIAHRSEDTYNIIRERFLDNCEEQYFDRKAIEEYLDERKPFDFEHVFEHQELFISLILNEYLNKNIG